MPFTPLPLRLSLTGAYIYQKVCTITELKNICNFCSTVSKIGRDNWRGKKSKPWKSVHLLSTVEHHGM